MKFMIQHNLINTESLNEIREAILDYPHEFIGQLPFSYEITSNEPIEGTDYIPYGSTLLTETTSGLGWKGCHFNLALNNYEAFVANRDDMLNSIIMPLYEAIAFLGCRDKGELWFIRPSLDLKQFSGLVDNAGDLVEWLRDRILCASSGSYRLDRDTMVVLGVPKSIVGSSLGAKLYPAPCIGTMECYSTKNNLTLK
jgi:hypothetical protein